MTTLKFFAAKNFSVPSSTSWYLADLGEFRGKQELYTRQSPQRLNTLREHALIESAVSSNRIEGVSVDPSRVRDVRALLLQCYQSGYEVGRYISLDRLIEENKDRYYETLEQSSQGWHEGKHDPWLYINYVLSIFKMAYREFAERVGEVKAPRGSKTDLVLAAINRFAGEFTVTQLEHACHSVSRDMIRRVLREQQSTGFIECQGRGPAARWKKKG